MVWRGPLILVFLASGCCCSDNYPDLIPQQRANWCWAASAQMIMRYHGYEVPQWRQAQDHPMNANLGFDCNPTAHKDSPPSVLNECNWTGYPQFDLYLPPDKHVFVMRDGYFSEVELEQQLRGEGRRKTPIAFEANLHVRVAVDFRWQDEGAEIYVLDPLPEWKGDEAWVNYKYITDQDYPDYLGFGEHRDWYDAGPDVLAQVERGP